MNDLEDITKLRISPLSMELTVDEKLGIIETECSIHADEKIREDVSAMCNLSQGIKDNTLVDVIINMYENNFTIDQIALATKKSVEEVKTIIEKRMSVLA